MGRKILVVDDDWIILNSCKKILEREDFEVVLAENVHNALSLIKESFDLFILDIKMPFKDGIFLMAEIKKRKPEAPIIAMSGYYTDETVKESFDAGASAFIPKPFTPPELMGAVRKILEEGGKT